MYKYSKYCDDLMNDVMFAQFGCLVGAYAILCITKPESRGGLMQLARSFRALKGHVSGSASNWATVTYNIFI